MTGKGAGLQVQRIVLWQASALPLRGRRRWCRGAANGRDTPAWTHRGGQ
jgi:hypothetical protein